MTTADDLIDNDIRDAAYHALLDARVKQLDLTQASAVVLHAVAPMIAAAELRRLTTFRQFRDLQDDLHARADELDPS